MVYYRQSFAAFLKPSFTIPEAKSALQQPLPCISHRAPSQLLLPQPLPKVSTHPQHSSPKNVGFPGSATDLLLLLLLPGRTRGLRQVWPSSVCYSHFWACPAKVWLPAARRRGTCSSPKQVLPWLKIISFCSVWGILKAPDSSYCKSLKMCTQKYKTDFFPSLISHSASIFYYKIFICFTDLCQNEVKSYQSQGFFLQTFQNSKFHLPRASVIEQIRNYITDISPQVLAFSSGSAWCL